ncbi:MAG: hypothetical protein OEQ74_08475, partial [Gammaproteobacteria bacterium]|nr:hypothetical protein [Gammaproteobacteria bacterium]
MHGYSSVSELRADALAVFKEQNQASGAVMLLLPALDPADPMTLALAEADTAMLAACEPLNKMAIALREDQPPSLR